MKQNLFLALPCDEVLRRVKKKWEFIKGFPFPKFIVRCPECGSTEIQARFWHFHYRNKGGCKYRCDVGFKCTVCSLAWVHGVAIPEEEYKKRMPPNQISITYHWREVKKILEEDSEES